MDWSPFPSHYMIQNVIFLPQYNENMYLFLLAQLLCMFLRYKLIIYPFKKEKSKTKQAKEENNHK